MGTKGKGSVILGTLLAGGCGPHGGATEPPADPVARPATSTPADAGVAAAPIADAAPIAAAPPDPLAGMTDEQRWRWAVERLPELTGLRKAPVVDFSALVDARNRVALHSPNLGADRLDPVKKYRRCSPLEFELKDGELVTRIPLDGKPARPEVVADHVELTLGVDVSDQLVLTKEGEGYGYGVAAGCGGDKPRLFESTADGVSYAGLAVRYGVECGPKVVKVACTDGPPRGCQLCQPSLYELRPNRAHLGMRVGGSGHDCEPCPPDTLRDDVPRLDAIARVDLYVVPFEGGEMFFRDRKACEKAATRRRGKGDR